MKVFNNIFSSTVTYAFKHVEDADSFFACALYKIIYLLKHFIAEAFL